MVVRIDWSLLGCTVDPAELCCEVLLSFVLLNSFSLGRILLLFFLINPFSLARFLLVAFLLVHFSLGKLVRLDNLGRSSSSRRLFCNRSLGRFLLC